MGSFLFFQSRLVKNRFFQNYTCQVQSKKSFLIAALTCESRSWMSSIVSCKPFEMTSSMVAYSSCDFNLPKTRFVFSPLFENFVSVILFKALSACSRQYIIERGNSLFKSKNSETFCGVTVEYVFLNISNALTDFNNAVHWTVSSDIPIMLTSGSKI